MRGVDLFAGWGGMTVGAAAAGMDVLWAANHWPLAVQAHKLNHPGTAHACQDLRQADWSALPEYDVLLAAPACQGHSNASQPKRRSYHDALRATAYAVLDCAAVTAPYAIVIENVPEFRNWGPVGRPDGRLYRHWREGLELLGYDVEEHVLTATDFGVPQLRKRLFLVATMARFGKLDFQAPKEASAPAFGPCIEWDAEGRWMRVADASAAIQARIAKGRRNHGAQFLTQHVTDHRGVSLDEPIRTITTKAQWNLVDGAHYRALTVREHARGMGFPDDYRWPEGTSKSDCIKGLGNAVCPPIATAIVGALADHLQLNLAAAA